MSHPPHLNESGQVHMVDVGDKAVTTRIATARGWLSLSAEALEAIQDGTGPKGDVLAVARVAAIQATKRTADWIPLCHPLPIHKVAVELTLESERVCCEVTVKTHGRTGVEMEALTAVSAGLLTVYDMIKAVDRTATIGPIQLEHKEGGRSGLWSRPPAT